MALIIRAASPAPVTKNLTLHLHPLLRTLSIGRAIGPNQSRERRGQGPRRARARDQPGDVVRQLLLHAIDGHVEADQGTGVRGLGRAIAVRPRQPHARRGDQLGLPTTPPAVRPRPADPLRQGRFDRKVTLLLQYLVL